MQAGIIDVNEKNLKDYPHVICFINPKHQYYALKIEWLRARFREGLKIKLLTLPGENRPVGFIEYVPGEKCWRAVDAAGFIFIHCLWTNGKKYQHQGLGAQLLEEVERDAVGSRGVAVLTSDSSFMAGRDIFLKHGYSLAAEDGKEQLLVKYAAEDPDGKSSLGSSANPSQSSPGPVIKDWRSVLSNYQDFTIIYSRQCPWVARFMEEVKPVLQDWNLKPEISELKTPAEAQKAPSLYATFNLIYRGQLLADRYISVTRFKNILKKTF